MNERDKELAMQAGDYVNKVYTPPVRSKTPGKIWEDGHVGWHTQFNAKFAALIRADERERIKAANAPEIERINTYIKKLEDCIRARENT